MWLILYSLRRVKSIKTLFDISIKDNTILLMNYEKIPIKESMEKKELSFEIKRVEIQSARFEDDGFIPNSEFPALIYRGVINIRPDTSPETLQKELADLVDKNNWRLEWAWRIYRQIHYHSTAHETLVVFSGNAIVQMGGPRVGKNFNLSKGDVLIIPAGVAHECRESSPDFQVFGLYPKGQNWDMNYGKRKERAKAIPNIENTSLPKKDPIYGGDDPLLEYWNENN